MKRQDGIALIASLLVMAAIMALGVGTLFLSTMNLEIAENSRTHAAARYNAEAGLEVAMVQLKKEYSANRRFPTSLTLPASPSSDVTYQLATDGYRTYSAGTQAQVIVIGTGPNSARYQTEALFGSANIVNPAFLIGLTSEGPVDVRGGGGAEFINAGVHSNTRVNLSGYSNDVFRKCADPQQAFSACAVADPLPVSTSDNNSCSMTNCNKSASKIYVDPAYTRKRNDVIAVNALGLVPYLDVNGQEEPVLDPVTKKPKPGEIYYAAPTLPTTKIDIDPKTTPTVYDKACAILYSSTNKPPETILAVATGAKICAKDGLPLNFATGINMTDAIIVADGNITFGGATIVNGTAGTLKNTKLISRTTLPPVAADDGSGSGGVMLDNVTGENLTIFTGANRDVSNPVTSNKPPYYLVGSGFKLTGDTTIASNRDIQFSGQTQLTTYPDKLSAVTTAIISTRKITNNGSSDFYGVFWAGKCFEQSGSSNIYGSIAVKEGGCGDGNAISGSGKMRINSSYRVDNSSLYGAFGVTVFSRR